MQAVLVLVQTQQCLKEWKYMRTCNHILPGPVLTQLVERERDASLSPLWLLDNGSCPLLLAFEFDKSDISHFLLRLSSCLHSADLIISHLFVLSSDFLPSSFHLFSALSTLHSLLSTLHSSVFSLQSSLHVYIT